MPPRMVGGLEHDDVTPLHAHVVRTSRVAQETGDLREHGLVRADHLPVFDQILELQFELGDRLGFVERDERPPVRQRDEEDPGAPLQRAAGAHDDDGVPPERRELGGRTRTLAKLRLHDTDDRAAQVVVHRRQRFEDVLGQRERDRPRRPGKLARTSTARGGGRARGDRF